MELFSLPFPAVLVWLIALLSSLPYSCCCLSSLSSRSFSAWTWRLLLLLSGSCQAQLMQEPPWRHTKNRSRTSCCGQRTKLSAHASCSCGLSPCGGTTSHTSQPFSERPPGADPSCSLRRPLWMRRSLPPFQNTLWASFVESSPQRCHPPYVSLRGDFRARCLLRNARRGWCECVVTTTWMCHHLLFCVGPRRPVMQIDHVVAISRTLLARPLLRAAATEVDMSASRPGKELPELYAMEKLFHSM